MLPKCLVDKVRELTVLLATKLTSLLAEGQTSC